MSAARKILPLTRQCARLFSQEAPKKYVKEVPSPYFKRFKENQKKFQIEDGVPVYLKAGFRDRMFFGSTLFLLSIAMAMTFETWYQLIKRN